MDINDITYKINGAIYEVNRVLGPGFLEKVYENALLIELRERGLKTENQVPIEVKYKGHSVGDYIADLLVEGKVIIELKTVENISTLHEAQLLNYLKATGVKVGLLVNFQNQKAQIKRMVLDLPEGHDSLSPVKSTDDNVCDRPR
ncbi:MAG: GxxExxY protein [Desulfobacteraceae bacterium]|nr:MAG: GxxExxY protein [Desulfobacteraceae bacterium]